MKRSIIKDIFNGTKGNIETMDATAIQKDNIKDVSNCYDELEKNFNPKQMKIIEKFLGVYNKNNCDEIDFYFAEGFKLGLLIAVECFTDN